MPPVINAQECTKCGKCYEACQFDVFFGSVVKEKVVVTYPEECWHCNACVMECDSGAISLRLPLTHQLMFHEQDSLTDAGAPLAHRKFSANLDGG